LVRDEGRIGEMERWGIGEMENRKYWKQKKI
jgi:hypothetical protein